MPKIAEDFIKEEVEKRLLTMEGKIKGMIDTEGAAAYKVIIEMGILRDIFFLKDLIKKL